MTICGLHYIGPGGAKHGPIMPYQVLIGAKEADSDQVALRLRDGRRLDALPAAEVLSRIGALVAAHSTELWETEVLA